MKVVVTIPAYNEEKTIGRVIDDINEVLSKQKYNYKILVVDDGSKDKTAEVARSKGARVYSHISNKGLANAFKTEIRESLKLNPDIIVHTDADGQYLAEDIPKLIEEVNNGYDLVLGSRFKGKIESMPLIKRIGNIAFSKLISGIIKFKISDCQTGFRAFNKNVAENIDIISDHTYTQEQIIKAVRMNFKIKEVPVYFAKRDGESRLMKGPFEYAFRAFVNLVRIYRDYNPLKFFMKLGGIFLFFGGIIGVYLLYLFFTTGMVKHIPLAILGVLLIMMGIQIVLFGFLADMNKK
ncbi:MAG: glycosyltransferase family 2 protein [Promethearchaeota archaeon]